MFGHLLIDPVDDRRGPGSFLYAGFQVVRNENPGNTAKVLVHVDVGGNPAFLILRKKSFYVGILAAGESTDEDISIEDFPGYAVDDRCCLPGPVNFQLFSRLTVDMHGYLGFHRELLVVVAELRIHEGNLVALPA